jgi:hypothetical protein
MEDTTVDQRNKIQRHLTNRYDLKQMLFEESDPVVRTYVEALWQQIAETNRLDLAVSAPKARTVNIDTINHGDVREIGAEWIGYHTWNKLQLMQLLLSKGGSGLLKKYDNTGHSFQREFI